MKILEKFNSFKARKICFKKLKCVCKRIHSGNILKLSMSQSSNSLLKKLIFCADRIYLGKKRSKNQIFKARLACVKISMFCENSPWMRQFEIERFQVKDFVYEVFWIILYFRNSISLIKIIKSFCVPIRSGDSKVSTLE